MIKVLINYPNPTSDYLKGGVSNYINILKSHFVYDVDCFIIGSRVTKEFLLYKIKYNLRNKEKRLYFPNYLKILIKNYPRITSGRKNFGQHSYRIIKTIEIIKKYFNSEFDGYIEIIFPVFIGFSFSSSKSNSG